MVPPLDICLEVRQEFVGAHELKIRFIFAPVPVISLPVLVVIPNYTYLVDHVCKAILERMPRSRQRLEKTPKDKVSKAVLSGHDPMAEYLENLHVGDYANTQRLLSIEPTAMQRPERGADQRCIRRQACFPEDLSAEST